MLSLAELFSLAGKSAIVTGGAKGIGQAIAARLAEAGAAVLLTDIDEPAAHQTAAEIRASGRTCEAMVADAANPDHAYEAVRRATERFGRLDILVNNAAIFPFTPALQITPEQWDRVLNTNLRGPFFFAQAAAKAMIAGGHPGRIINIASIDALHPTGALAHYDASKGGLVMLTKSLALELAPYGILVNAIAPGGIATPGAAAAAQSVAQLSGSAEQAASRFLERLPLKRMGEPDEIARIALFLAGPAADYITGELIVADGGYLLS
ncbi:MAG: SDR family NAD(P)-dependent oxidoreductase [Chloroflexota bacterium]|nr:SDR family oxidoreductase [Dehalococcoidia bacterium]MDW8252496.1 SDR family NAD(P)-dependent oxidoreductase [Chloroflexota bacterium]